MLNFKFFLGRDIAFLVTQSIQHQGWNQIAKYFSISKLNIFLIHFGI